jgi:integrase
MAKKTKKTATKRSAVSIKEVTSTKGGVSYTYYQATYTEDGARKRKQFKTEDKAKNFAAVKEINLLNTSTDQKSVLSRLSQKQIDEAQSAFDMLGGTYTLSDAITFFLSNHRAPSFTISIRDAIKAYLIDIERKGIRSRTAAQTRSVLNQFRDHADGDLLVHEVTSETIVGYLSELGTKDGESIAKRKTWNNYRTDLNGFFAWASTKDVTSQRPWTFINPVTNVSKFSAKQIAEQRPEIKTTEPQVAQDIFTHLMAFSGGALVKFYAYAYFAGIRPGGELVALSKRESELVNLRTGIISIPASISKTKEARKVTITPNLSAWLKAYKAKPIIPQNFDRLNKEFRKTFSLTHDEARHSFISYHVAVNRSVGDAALQAGNSEGIVKKHYLNLHPREDGEHFFALVPDMGKAECVRDEKMKLESPLQMKAI